VHSFLPLVLAVLAITLGVSAQSVNWVQYINPSGKDDVAFGSCLFDDYLAVVGFIDGEWGEIVGRQFVALLNRTTGEVIKTWEGGDGRFYNCLPVGDRLYAVGRNETYAFDRDLNVVKKVEVDLVPRAVAFDGSYLYIAGIILRDVDGDGDSEVIWRIEKRTLDLDLVAYREFYREWDKAYRYGSDAYDIAINPATGELWVVGEWDDRTAGISGNVHSLLVIFDRELNVTRAVEYPWWHENYLGELNGVYFDEEGNAYVVGDDGVAKFDRSGNVLAVNRKVEGNKIACVGGRVYVFDERYMDGYQRHVLYLIDERLNLLGEYVLSRDVEANSYFFIGKPAFDGRSLYVAGYDYALGRSRIVVYSISIANSANTASWLPVETVALIVVATVGAVLMAALARRRGAEARKTQPITQTVPQPRVGETSAVGDFCLEYQGGVIPLAGYTVVGRGDFSGLSERVLEMVEERHFAVYFKDGVWWVEDLGSRHGTYLNGVKIKKERLRDGDVISPGAAVAVVFKRCGTTRRVVPMEEGTKTY